jgi:hypothetical protein
MEHTRCGYAATLGEVLREPLVVGQGGTWEATPPNIYLALVPLEASLSSSFATQIKLAYPERTRELIETAAAAYGRYRGEAIRRRVEEMGLPLDIPHMWEWWDLPVTSARDGERMNDDLESFYHGFEIPACPFNDIYQLLYPQDLMALHCEAMHEAAFKAYNHAIEFWLPALLPRGEGRCVFRLRIPPDEAEKVARRAAATEGVVRGTDDTVTSFRLVARQVVIIYHFFMDTLLSAVGQDETERVVRRAMADWGAWRGREMREAHLARGWPLDLRTFATYFDVPAAEDAWVAEDVVLTPSEYRLTVTKSAFSELFEQLATGSLAALFFEEALPAQARAYNPAMTLTIPRLIERGDGVTQYHYAMSG